MPSSEKTFRLALGGICLAFTVICVFCASIVPGVELSLYALASVFLGFMIIETGIKGGLILYAASVLLCFILIPAKTALIPYVFFFGIYGIVKYAAEKVDNIAGQLALKILFFAAVFGVGYLFFRKLFFGNITLPEYSEIILVIGGIIMFVLYDLIYTLIINLYMKRIRKKKRTNSGQAINFKLYQENEDEEEENEKQ